MKNKGNRMRNPPKKKKGERKTKNKKKLEVKLAGISSLIHPSNSPQSMRKENL